MVEVNEKNKSSFGTVTIFIKASEKYFHCYTVQGSSGFYFCRIQ